MVFLLHALAPTPYSAVFLLHAPAPAPIKIGCGLVRCGSCGLVGCVGEAYTPKYINFIVELPVGQVSNCRCLGTFDTCVNFFFFFLSNNILLKDSYTRNILRDSQEEIQKVQRSINSMRELRENRPNITTHTYKV